MTRPWAWRANADGGTPTRPSLSHRLRRGLDWASGDTDGLALALGLLLVVFLVAACCGLGR